MRAYELGVIIDGDLDEPIAQRWIKVVNDQVKAAGGESVGHPEWWGKRRFAYEINKKEEGYYVGPTLIDYVTPDMRIAQEEVFGPVLAVIPFEDEEEAIAIGNDVVKHVDIDITAVQQLTLVATNGVADNVYFDHADWADAKLIA